MVRSGWNPELFEWGEIDCNPNRCIRLGETVGPAQSRGLTGSAQARNQAAPKEPANRAGSARRLEGHEQKRPCSRCVTYMVP